MIEIQQLNQVQFQTLQRSDQKLDFEVSNEASSLGTARAAATCDLLQVVH